MNWPRAIIADLDGTLVDSAPDIRVAANTALSPYGISASLEQILAWLGHGARALVVKALAAHQIQAASGEIDAVTAAFSARYEAEPCLRTQPFAGVVDTFQSLRRGGVSTAVCSNKPDAIARLVLEHTGLAKHIDVVVGGGLHALKPAPDGLLACLSQLGIDRSEAAYIGDHQVDVEAARAAGVPVLLAEFGYSQTPVAALGADATFAHWQDLPTQLARLRP